MVHQIHKNKYYQNKRIDFETTEEGEIYQLITETGKGQRRSILLNKGQKDLTSQKNSVRKNRNQTSILSF